MDFLIDFFSGRKTYSVAAAAAVVTFALQMGWINADMAAYILAYLGIGGAAAFRSALKKTEIRSR